MRFFHTHMKKSRFSFINKNDTLYSKKGNGSPFLGNQRRENHERNEKPGRPRHHRCWLCPVFHVLRRRERDLPAVSGHGIRTGVAGRIQRVFHRGHRPCACRHVCAAARRQQRGRAPARRPCAGRDPHVRDHPVRRPDGRHPAHIRQHVRNGHRAESARCVGRGVLGAVFRAHPRAVHPRVRRGGHRGQGAHAAAAARPCGHHRQGHRHAARHDRGRDEDRQRRRDRCQVRLPDHGRAR